MRVNQRASTAFICWVVIQAAAFALFVKNQLNQAHPMHRTGWDMTRLDLTRSFCERRGVNEPRNCRQRP